MTLHRVDVAVVGGGIAGLAAAHQLATERPDLTVAVLEASGRLGGKIRTEDFEGIPLDTGPDAFIARVPHGTALARKVGLGDDLISPSAGKAWLWWRGELRALPEGLVLGVPAGIMGLARSGILSPAGLARAAADLVLPATKVKHRDILSDIDIDHEPDRSVGDLISARLGPEVLDRLVDPLLGGIHAGWCGELSLFATAPQLAEAARSHRSLVLGLREMAKRAPKPEPGAAPAPVFHSVRGGLGRLVDAIARDLAAAPAVEVRLDWPTEPITRSADGTRWVVPGPDGNAHEAAAVILATPAVPAAASLHDAAPRAAAELGGIDHASVALATLSYPKDAWTSPRPGSGYLVPRSEGRLTTAVSWASAKWPDATDADHLVVRVSAGRHHDDRAQELDDDELVRRLHAELAEAMDVRAAAPTAVRVTRWPGAFPQYTTGHLERVVRIEEALREQAPGIFVAGGAYRGVGIPACIASGQAAAASATESVKTAPDGG